MQDRIIIDWIEYTYLSASDVDNAISIIGLDMLSPMPLPRGAYGYKEQYIDTLTGIRILAEGQQSMGTHVIISGKSCRALEALNVDIIELIVALESDAYNITRIDIALDIYNNVNIMDNIISAHKEGSFKSKWRSSKVIESTKGGVTATTIYYGSRQSEIMCRIYDKQLESGTEYAWVRIELEIKKEYAKSIAELLMVERLADIYSGLLNNYLTYLERRENNVTRSKPAKWWRALIDDSRRISLYNAPEIKSYEEIKEWLIKSIGPSLVTVLMAEQGSDVINKMISHGQNQLKEKHKTIITRGQKQNEQRMLSR